jgi:uncharacterized membrane protein
MMPQFPVKTELAQKMGNHFEKELDHKIKTLPLKDRENVKLEILSHLYESSINDKADKEESRIINAIERLGTPDEYLTPLVSDILLNLKAKNGNPLAIVKSLFNNIQISLTHTLATIVLGIAYLFIIMIFIMSIAHIFISEAGLWIHDSGERIAFSFTAHENSNQWLPEWFTFIGLITSVGCYLIFNRVLFYFLNKNK